MTPVFFWNLFSKLSSVSSQNSSQKSHEIHRKIRITIYLKFLSESSAESSQDSHQNSPLFSLEFLSALLIKTIFTIREFSSQFSPDSHQNIYMIIIRILSQFLSELSRDFYQNPFRISSDLMPNSHQNRSTNLITILPGCWSESFQYTHQIVLPKSHQNPLMYHFMICIKSLCHQIFTGIIIRIFPGFPSESNFKILLEFTSKTFNDFNWNFSWIATEIFPVFW